MKKLARNRNLFRRINCLLTQRFLTTLSPQSSRVSSARSSTSGFTSRESIWAQQIAPAASHASSLLIECLSYQAAGFWRCTTGTATRSSLDCFRPLVRSQKTRGTPSEMFWTGTTLVWLSANPSAVPRVYEPVASQTPPQSWRLCHHQLSH